MVQRGILIRQKGQFDTIVIVKTPEGHKWAGTKRRIKRFVSVLQHWNLQRPKPAQTLSLSTQTLAAQASNSAPSLATDIGFLDDLG